VNLITAKEIRERLERARWIDEGRRRAKGLLEQHENKVHKVAAHLSRSRRLDADEFNSLMEAAG
jgi:ATP-dependent Zn protease